MLEVLLSTYNGECYLGALLDSLAAQTRTPDIVRIRDDGSKAETIDLLNGLAPHYSLPVDLIRDHEKRLGPRASFARLLATSRGDIVFLADQDDVWDKMKISLLSREVERMEARYGADVPAYAYSDTRLVDAHGNILANSGWQAQGFKGSTALRLSSLIVQNVVPGCALAVNRALVNMALPVPSEAVMHDWWLLLVGACFGHGVCLHEALVDYRQHAENTLGVTTWGVRRVVSKTLRTGIRNTKAGVVRRFEESIRQTKAFETRYAALLPSEHRELVHGLANVPYSTGWHRKIEVASLGVRKDSLLRTLALYWSL